MTDKVKEDRANYSVHISPLSEQIEDDDLSHLTMGQRIELAMQLSQDMYALAGVKPDPNINNRHVVRVYRR